MTLSFLEQKSSPEAIEEFLKKHPGCAPRHTVRDWIKDVDDAHRNIRKLMGGHSIKLKINVDQDQMQGWCNNIKEYIDNLLNYIPGYLSQYNLKKEDLEGPFIGKVKTHKHIVTYIRKYKFADYYQSGYAISSANSLEEEKKRSTIKSGTYHAILTTLPEAFLNIARYKCDEGSCFGQNRDNREHKFRYSLLNDSFIVLISKEEFSDNVFDIKANGRIFGWMQDPSSWAVHNMYMTGINHSVVVHCVKTLIDSIAPKMISKVIMDAYQRTGGIDIYQNGDEINLYASREKDMKMSCKKQLYGYCC